MQDAYILRIGLPTNQKRVANAPYDLTPGPFPKGKGSNVKEMARRRKGYSARIGYWRSLLRQYPVKCDYSFPSIPALPVAQSTGTETCEWKIFQWPPTLWRLSVTRKVAAIGLPSLPVQVKC